MIFASSIAVYGAPFPETIPDDFHLTPLTSYGTQKAMSELLLADYSRRGFLDGIGLRLPTICIRPGAPNKAASGFFSNILREPLAGKEAVLPVEDDVRHWHASPRAAVGFFRHAMRLDLARLGPRRSLAMPGLSATVAEQIEALRRAAGEKAVALIRREPDAGDPAHRRRLGDAARRVAGARRSASSPTPRSTRSSPPTSRTSSADGSLCERGHFRASRCGGKMKRRLANGRHREDDDALVCADGCGAAAGGGRRSGADRGAAASAGCFGGGAARSWRRCRRRRACSPPMRSTTSLHRWPSTPTRC